MAERIYIADKPTLDAIKNIVDQYLDESISSRQAQVLSQAQANRLDANISSRQANWGATTTHRDRIDTTISSRASQATVNTINTNVSNINSKINAGVGIKSVQRGITSFTDQSSDNEKNITISPVNLSKTFISYGGYEMGGTQIFYTSPYLTLTSSTNLKIKSYGAQNVSTVAWEVIEFN